MRRRRRLMLLRFTFFLSRAVNRSKRFFKDPTGSVRRLNSHLSPWRGHASATPGLELSRPTRTSLVDWSTRSPRWLPDRVTAPSHTLTSDLVVAAQAGGRCRNLLSGINKIMEFKNKTEIHFGSGSFCAQMDSSLVGTGCWVWGCGGA